MARQTKCLLLEYLQTLFETNRIQLCLKMGFGVLYTPAIQRIVCNDDQLESHIVVANTI